MGVAYLITGCGCGFVRMRIKTIQTSNKNFILKYFRCRDGKRTETRIGMEGICITHSCIPLYTVYMQHIMAHSGGMQEWVIQIPSIPILVSVLFPSLHLKYFRIKFLLLVTMTKITDELLWVSGIDSTVQQVLAGIELGMCTM